MKFPSLMSSLLSLQRFFQPSSARTRPPEHLAQAQPNTIKPEPSVDVFSRLMREVEDGQVELNKLIDSKEHCRDIKPRLSSDALARDEAGYEAELDFSEAADSSPTNVDILKESASDQDWYFQPKLQIKTERHIFNPAAVEYREEHNPELSSGRTVAEHRGLAVDTKAADITSPDESGYEAERDFSDYPDPLSGYNADMETSSFMSEGSIIDAPLTPSFKDWL